MTVGVLGVSWDETTRSLGTQEWLGIDVGLRRYVAHIMENLAPGMTPPPIEGLDVLSGATWGLTGTPPVLSPVNAEPLGASEIRVGAGGATVAGALVANAGIAAVGNVTVDGDLTIGSATRAMSGDLSVGRDVLVGRNVAVAGYGDFGSLRVTELLTPTPTEGKGLELLYSPTLDIGFIQCIDRDAGAQVPLTINATTLNLNAPLRFPTMTPDIMWGDFAGDYARISWTAGAMYYDTSGVMAIRATGGVLSSGDIGARGIFTGPSMGAGWPITGDINVSRGNGTGYVFLGSGSYHIGFDGSQYLFSGGVPVNIPQNLNFAANGYGFYGVAGHAVVGIHSGGGLFTSGGIYYEGGLSVRMWWNGGSIQTTHQMHLPRLHVDGALVTNNWDVGWSNSLGGNVICSGVLQTQSRLVTNNWDIGWANNMGGDTVFSGVAYGSSGLTGFHGAFTSYAMYAPHIGNANGQIVCWNFLAHTGWSSTMRALAGDHQPVTDALDIVKNPALHATRYVDTWRNAGLKRDGTPNEPVEGVHVLTLDGPWHAAVPEVTSTSVVDGEILLNYDAVGAITFEAVKQLAAQVERLTARTTELEAQLEAQQRE